jgi:hypothetical protein
MNFYISNGCIKIKIIKIQEIKFLLKKLHLKIAPLQNSKVTFILLPKNIKVTYNLLLEIIVKISLSLINLN